MDIEKREEEIYELLGREFSYREDGAPSPKIMTQALNEMTLDLEAEGKKELSHYVCVQSLFYCGILELVQNVSIEELRKGRAAEEAKYTLQERDDIRRKAARAYCLETEYERAAQLYQKGKRVESVKLLQELAQQDHYYASLQLANIYISQMNFTDAVQLLYRLLARRTNEKVYLLLGNLYYDGLGVNKNRDAACEYYEKAAAMGCVEAMNKTAKMHFYGQVSNASFSKASYWYDKAAQEENQAGIYMSGICKLFREDTNYFSEVEDRAMWNEGTELLKRSEDERALPMLHYVLRKLPHGKEPQLLGLKELYEMLCRDQKENKYIYRGQTQVYAPPLRPSAYRPCRYSRFAMEGEPNCQIRNWGREFYLENNDYERLGKNRTAHAVKRIMSMYVNNALGYPLTQALFQQAGYSSEGLDVSYDFHMSLFFALYEYRNGSYFRKESKKPSILYRWKLPEKKMSLQDNYYSGAHFIPTLDILSSFDVCESVEESIASLERYLDKIGFGEIGFSIPDKRPFELIKLPKGCLTDGRIALQKGALLIPDVIQGYWEQERHIEWGYKLNQKTSLEFKLVQDLGDPSICDRFLIDCSNLKDSDFDILSSLPAPEDIYDDAQEDITHILTHNIFERAHRDIMATGTPFLEIYPAMPGYDISYQDALHQLEEWNRGRNRYQYFFES